MKFEIQDEVSRKICEVVDCNNDATQKLEVSAGRYGTIEILVCKSCVSKFQEDGSID